MNIRDRIKELRRVPASELLPNPKNWRRHPQAQQDAMRAVLQEIGYAGALLAREVDGKILLIDGHLRAEITPTEQVPVLVLDVNEAEADKLLATYDPLSAMAEKDDEALKTLLKGIQFEEPALKEWTNTLIEMPQEPLVEPPAQMDKAAELQKKWGTQLGQLWEIGEHRLMCGDSRTAQLDNSFHLIATSPPYNQQREYKLGEFNWLDLLSSVSRETFPMLGDGGNALIVLGLVHKDRCVDMYWQPWLDACAEAGWPLFGWYVWDKGSGFPGEWNGRLCPAHEFVFHFNNTKTKAHKWIATQGRTDKKHQFRQKDGTIRALTSPDKVGQPYKIPDSVIRITAEQSRGIHTETHPAVYPVALPAFFMNTWTNEKDFVLDPFCGSGTTLIAAHQLNRIGYGIEIDPGYCAVALQRLADLGLSPKLINE